VRPWLSVAPVLATSLVALSLAGCAGTSREAAATPSTTAAAPPAQLGELWVDASVFNPGDGSGARPFKTLQEALATPSRPLVVHLRSGLYPGPFTLPDGATLQGEGQVVLFVEGTGTVVTASGEARLRGLTVQGGGAGIEAEGSLALENVQLSGQRRAAVRMTHGALRVEGCTFQASVSETSGLLLEAGTRTEVRDSRFLGPYWRAIHARGAQRVSVEDARFEGAVTGLHQVGGEAVVRRSSFTGGRGPGLFLARGSLRVEEVRVKGHEYALQTRQANPLWVRDFASVGAERAGLGLTETRAELEDVVLVSSGAFGGLQSIESDVVARRLRVQRPSSYGVNARGGKLRLEEAVITNVVDKGEAGNGVELRQCTAEVSGLTVVDAGGIGVLVAQGSKATLHDVRLERCRWAGVMAETLGEVRGSSVTVRDSPGSAVAVPGDGVVELYRLISEKNAEGAVWAECARGAKVTLIGLREDGPARPRPGCVQP
jgi:hypothetical protein